MIEMLAKYECHIASVSGMGTALGASIHVDASSIVQSVIVGVVVFAITNLLKFIVAKIKNN